MLSSWEHPARCGVRPDKGTVVKGALSSLARILGKVLQGFYLKYFKKWKS